MNELEEQETIVEEISVEELQRLAEEAKQQRQEELEDLAKQIESKFNIDASRRSRKEQEWYTAERLILGSAYRAFNRWGSTDRPFTTGDDGRDSADKPEHNIVRPKLEIAKAQLEMLQFGAGSDKNFQIKAKQRAEDYSKLQDQPALQPDGMTPMQGPDGQPMTVGQLVQLANSEEEESAKQMDEEVFCQLSNCGYGKKMRDGMDDMLLYGSAVFRGPINNVKCSKLRSKMQTSEGKTIWVTSYSETPSPDFERINPWLFFPDHRALCIEDAEHCTVCHILTAKQMRHLTKRDGFLKDQITELLKQKAAANYYPDFRSRAAAYDNTDYLDGKYVVLEWHGIVSRDELDRLNIEPPYENPHDVYRAEIWACQGKVIFASLEMLEADDDLPIAHSTWEKDPSNFFGFGAILIRDPQRVVNKTYQMILDNAGLVALPQAIINKEMVKPIDGKPEITPGKVWYSEYPNGKAGDFVNFFTPPIALEELSAVLQMAKAFGDEESMIPLIQGGLGDPQLGDTGATGLAMVMKASTSVLSSKARDWDDNITKKVVCWFYEWNMQYSEKEEIKGDYDVDVQTSTSYLNVLQGQRDLERLCLEYSQNEMLHDILNGDELYRARLISMNIPYDLIVRSKEDIDRIRQARAQNQQPNPDDMKAQAAMIVAQAKQMDAENTAKQIEFDSAQGFQQAQMDHKEKMAQYQVRDNEQEARRYEAEIQREIEMIKHQDQMDNQRMETVRKATETNQKISTDKFKAGIKAVQDQQKLNLEDRNTKVKEREADKVAKDGKGW